MADPRDVVIKTYSERAGDYDREGNLESCWGQVAKRALQQLSLKDRYEVVADIGCGAGHALRELASRVSSVARFVGVEPAEEMRGHAAVNLAGIDNVTVMDGRFEQLPLESDSVDYLFSILAFHWVTDLEGSARELERVLKQDGEMDLFFVGRDAGLEFVKKTTPIFLRYMGLAWLVESAKMRKHLSRDGAEGLFGNTFPADRLSVTEEYRTYHDDLEGHWSWWVPRLGAHFAAMPQDKREQCDRESREAIASLATADGIPYEVHLLHVKLRSDS
jgi:ubiquinone/menaquinone biosynthesis C-methylase UbiE